MLTINKKLSCCRQAAQHICQTLLQHNSHTTRRIHTIFPWPPAKFPGDSPWLSGSVGILYYITMLVATATSWINGND